MLNVVSAFLLTLVAGLSTGIGSLIALMARRTNRRFLSISLGFSAGVMIYVSMIEIFQQAQDSLTAALGEGKTELAVRMGYFQDQHQEVEAMVAQIREEQGLADTPAWTVSYYPSPDNVELIEFLWGSTEAEGEGQEAPPEAVFPPL